MEENDNVSKKTRLKPEMIIALCATFISIATLIVYIYQARVMIRQAEIMQSQQHISVWPYLETLTTTMVLGDKPDEAYYEIENKGIGPAIVKQVTMKVDGVIMKGNNELFEAMIGKTDTLSISTTVVKNRVIAPGEKIRAFHIIGDDLVKRFAIAFQKKKFEYIICYCSVYNECWTSNANIVTKGDCQ
ncbi:MAG: hypothetical protein ACKVOQ_07665 [Cyclobacteriaceae bacterium]